MHRAFFAIAALLLSISPAVAQETTPVPDEVKKHMRSMVGAWTFSGSQGDRTFSGEEEITLTSNETALLQVGFFQLDGGKKEYYSIFSGWDGQQETVLVRGFTTMGATWTGEWKTLDDGTWIGTASGGLASFEVNAETMRYEDSGDGTPWVSEFVRKPTGE